LVLNILTRDVVCPHCGEAAICAEQGHMIKSQSKNCKDEVIRSTFYVDLIVRWFGSGYFS